MKLERPHLWVAAADTAACKEGQLPGLLHLKLGRRSTGQLHEHRREISEQSAEGEAAHQDNSLFTIKLKEP